jgi:two-component system, NarL family, nitrate/nitrite response regulator NarL
MSCRILLVDEHEVTRIGLKALLSSLKSVTVCGESGDGIDAIRKAHELNPDIIILDHCISKANGSIVTRRVLKRHPEQKVLIFGVTESKNTVRDLLQAGIKGFVSKADPEMDILCAIDALQQNRTYFTSYVEKLILDEYLHPRTSSETQDDYLSLREQEVLQLLAEGTVTKDVALVLGISTKTAETHRSNIMRKLGVHNLAQVTIYAVAHHILKVPVYGRSLPYEQHRQRQSAGPQFQVSDELQVLPTQENAPSPLRLSQVA